MRSHGSMVADEIWRVDVAGPLVGRRRELGTVRDRVAVLFGTAAFLGQRPPPDRGEVGSEAVEVLVGGVDAGGERGAFGGVGVARRAPAADGWGGEFVEAALVGVALPDRALAELDEIESLLLGGRAAFGLGGRFGLVAWVGSARRLGAAVFDGRRLAEWGLCGGGVALDRDIRGGPGRFVVEELGGGEVFVVADGHAAGDALEEVRVVGWWVVVVRGDLGSVLAGLGVLGRDVEGGVLAGAEERGVGPALRYYRRVVNRSRFCVADVAFQEVPRDDLRPALT